MFRKTRPATRPDVDRRARALEGIERRERVVAVESEVPREVVPRPERHADERHVALDRHARDRGERAVAARDPERVRVGVPSERLDVLTRLKDVDGETPGAGPRPRARRRTGGRSRSGVDDQEARQAPGSVQPG